MTDWEEENVFLDKTNIQALHCHPKEWVIDILFPEDLLYPHHFFVTNVKVVHV
jgi:hypothetical protein